MDLKPCAKRPNRQICLSCKGGRLLCGEKYCPLLPKIDYSGIQAKMSKDMFGPSTSVFVGWRGYPTVSVGPMTSITDDAEILDNPGAWYGMPLTDIISMRSQLIHGNQRRPIFDSSRFACELRELALSVKPVYAESNYKKIPQLGVSFSPMHQPIGAQAEIKRFRITENTIIPKRVEYILDDDLKAKEQAEKLFGKNFDVYYITNVLSSGALGYDMSKKMVPTRWSITAVDDMLSKKLIESIKNHAEVSEIRVYENTYMDNHFEVLLLPGSWEFELFEAWSPKTIWGSQKDIEVVLDYESNRGRKQYAYNEGGGYYAARFAAAEALDTMRRQGRCVIFREIYDSYVMPVGVWEVRENVRAAMAKKPKKFNSLNDALADISTRINLPLEKFLRKSTILTQRRITDY
jgi:DNA repair protein NreA